MWWWNEVPPAAPVAPGSGTVTTGGNLDLSEAPPRPAGVPELPPGWVPPLPAGQTPADPPPVNAGLPTPLLSLLPLMLGAPPPKPADGEQQFRDAAKKNGVPGGIVDIIIDSAKGTKVPRAPRLFFNHNSCEQWVDKFQANLITSLTNHGFKNGLNRETGGGIASGDKVVVKMNNWGGHDHTLYVITFKDGSKFVIDNETSSEYADPATGVSHVTPYDAIPKKWKPY